WSQIMDTPMVTFMEASGFEVVNSDVAGYVAGVELGRAGSQAAYELGCRADRPEADAVIMPGGNWPAVSVVERLERDPRKPAPANNAGSLGAGVRLLQCPASTAGHSGP